MYILRQCEAPRAGVIEHEYRGMEDLIGFPDFSGTVGPMVGE